MHSESLLPDSKTAYIKRCAAMIAAFVLVQPAITQNFFQNYTANFPATNVADIIQDKEGFTWFGSSEGLTRFDGKNFSVYLHSDIDSTSIADNNINCLFLDGGSNLWIGTRGGLSKYNQITNDFTNFYYSEKDTNSLSSNEIWSIGQDSSGNIWAGTLNAGLNKLNQTTGTSYNFTRYIHDSTNIRSISDNSVWYIHFDDKGFGWIGTSDGLNIFKPGDKKQNFSHYRNDAINSASLANNFVWRIYQDAEKNIWISSIYGTLDFVGAASDRQHLSFIHIAPFIEQKLNASINLVYDFCKDAYGNCWISVNANGLITGKITINNNGVQIKNLSGFLHEPGNRVSLVNNMIWKLYSDRNGFIWCGTQRGVSVYDPYKEQFDTWNTIRNKTIPENKVINGIHADEHNNIWLASEEALFVLTERGLKRINGIGNVFVAAYNHSNAGLFVAAGNGLLYASPGKVSSFINGKKNKLSLIPAGNSIPNFPAFARLNFLKPQNDELFAGGSGKLASIDLNNLTVHDYSWMYAVLSSDMQKTFRDVCLQKNFIWLGTDDGLFVFDRLTKKYIRRFNTISALSLSSNRINCLYFDGKEHIYIGTDDGLNIYNIKRQSITILFARNGLPDNNIRSITSDKKGVIWIATRNGLCSYNPFSGKIQAYTTLNGLLSNQLNCVETGLSGNALLIGSDNGLNVLGLTDYRCPPPPKIAFTDFLIHGKTILTADTTLTTPFRTGKEMQLNYRQNYFTIAFTVFDYSNPAGNPAAYKLENFDTGWVYTNDINTPTYTNLKAGKYVFRVRGANSYGIWNNRGISMVIVITPPWWQTKFFYLMCILVAAGAIYMVYKIRLNRVLADQRMRNKIASDLHDDVGSSLSGISIYSELAKAKTQDENPDLYRILDAISENTKVTQQNMDDIVWSIKPYNDSFDKIITRMKTFAAEMLEPKEIELKFAADESLGDFKLSSERRKNFFLIFKEAINNCAKYSDAKTVYIELKKQSNAICLSIRDDGKGFDTDKTDKGNGLDTMMSRAKELKGIFSITSFPGKGTCIQLNFTTT